MERFTEWSDLYKGLGVALPGKDCATQLAKYEDTGITPEQIFEMDRLYSEKCREVADLKQKVRELFEQLEVTCKDIRERTEQDYVCGLCEYSDCVYIGAEGDYCGECPGFDRADCFKMSESYKKKFLGEEEGNGKDKD